MDKRKKYALISIIVALIAAVATVPGIWHYTETNSFCNDCHKNMNFNNEEALSQGLASEHYQEHLHDSEIACEECHRGPGISGMIDVKVIQASHEVYQYFLLGTREMPRSGDYSSENCMKEGCHPSAETQHNFSIQNQECIKCHSGHHRVHESAQKATFTAPLNCMKCHNKEINETHVSYNATTQNCTNCHNQREMGNITQTVCEDCHSNQDQNLFFSKHKGGECKECHGTHKEIESCSQSGCHEDIHNDELTECGDCHSSAHAKRKIMVNDSNQCLTCHEEDEPVQKLRTEGDAHKEVNCTECHNGDKTHGQIPGCSQTDCHDQPHGPEVTDCYSCHEEGAHNPLPVNLTEESCSRCHQEETSTLENSETEHSEMTCVSCHEDEGVEDAHGYTPTCEDCHSDPHPYIFELVDEYSNDSNLTCYSCHESGHNPVTQ